MFNKFKNFGVFVLVQFCINTVNAMDEYVIGSNKNESNWYINNTNTIQNNIRDFISTCNNEDDFSIGQKSMIRNIVKSINNINTNNLNNLSLITLEAENKTLHNEYLVPERTITFRDNKNLDPHIKFAEEPSKITENKYKNFLNCINICSKENIISKEEHFNFKKNITGK